MKRWQWETGAVFALALVGAAACAATSQEPEPAEARLQFHPRGSGTLLELGVGDHFRVAEQFPVLFGQAPGPKIVGKGRSLTLVKGPLHFRGAFPELSDVSVLCESEEDTTVFIDHAGEEQRACVVFENALAASTQRVTIRNNVVGAWSMVQIATPAGAPPADWRAADKGGSWPNRHEANTRLWRDSKSEHRELEVLSSGGGGIYAANLVTDKDRQAWRKAAKMNCCDGNFTNHLRFFGGHVQVGGSWRDVQAWLGVRESPGWEERFAPMAAFEVRGTKLELFGMHADVMPHLGVLMYGTSRFSMGIGSSFMEPAVNWRRTERAADNAWGKSSPGWIIGGDAAGCPSWSKGPERAVSAKGFKALQWPSYMFGPKKGNVFFECSADW
ncbi:MAG: hypothetical protein AAFN78_09015 [Pseudomonadota bacterium]